MSEDRMCACGCGEPSSPAETNIYRKGVLIYRKGDLRQYVTGHRARAFLDPVRQLMRHVQVVPSGCWIWTGARLPTGYGWARVGGRSRAAHLQMWRAVRGPVPHGLELDHLCRETLCCNPDHLEPVTHAENVHRSFSPSAVNLVKTHCLRGHEFTEENIYRPPKRPHTRQCRACISIRVAARAAAA